jgi:hypothetical protein
MKFLLSSFVLCVLSLTSSTAAFGQKTRTVATFAQSRPRKVESAVIIQSPEAFTDGSGTYIRWSTSTETNNLGFYVFRVDKGSRDIVDNKFVTGSAIKYRSETVTGEQYSIFDSHGNSLAQYVIESYQKDGSRSSSDQFGVKFVADLSVIAGRSSADFFQQQLAATGNILQNDLIYNKELQGNIEDHTQFADPNMQRWIAAQPGVKLGVRREGVYRVTRTQLQSAGFDINSDPNLWQLYTDGVEQAIIVGPNGDYVDFYGKTIDTVESDTKMYYLVVGSQAGLRMGTVGLRAGLSTVLAQNYPQAVGLKERSSYLLDVFNGEAENYWGHLVGNFDSSVTVNASSIDTNATTSTIFFKSLGYSTTPHLLNVSVNGHNVGQATGTTGGGSIVTLTATFPTSYLVEGSNTIGMITTDANDYGFFDQVQIAYNRRHVSSQGRLPFTMQNYRGAKIEGFSSSNVRVFDTTYDGTPALVSGVTVTPDGGTFDAIVSAYRVRSMYAVEDSGLLTPATIAANTPSTLSTSNHNANLLIITYKDFRTQADAWADYRRGQGVSVEVVDVEDVFDEFNYGVLSANSVRSFLSFTKDVWQTPPHYVLLVGDGSYDPRNYEGNGNWDLIPAKLVDTVYSETASDDAMADFNNDGLAEMAIGRVPARTTDQVTNALTHTATFENLTTSGQNLSRGAIFLYDSPLGWDFQGMSNQMSSQLPAGTTSIGIGRNDANAKQTLITELNNGRYTMNFSGHGTFASWIAGSFWNLNDVSSITNVDKPTVYTLLTCLNGYFIAVTPSLSEALLNSTTGGAAATWASTGETTPDIQQVMGIRFYNQLGAGQITRLGDLILDAKTVVPGGRDVRESWVLLGDPMLKMH